VFVETFSGPEKYVGRLVGRSVSRLRPEANKDNSETASRRKGKQFYLSHSPGAAEETYRKNRAVR
jgi:hypothetical protein